MVELESLCVAQAGAEHVALLPQFPQCCDYRCVPSCQAELDFFKKLISCIESEF